MPTLPTCSEALLMCHPINVALSRDVEPPLSMEITAVIFPSNTCWWKDMEKEGHAHGVPRSAKGVRPNVPRPYLTSSLVPPKLQRYLDPGKSSAGSVLNVRSVVRCPIGTSQRFNIAVDVHHGSSTVHIVFSYDNGWFTTPLHVSLCKWCVKLCTITSEKIWDVRQSWRRQRRPEWTSHSKATNPVQKDRC